MSAAGNQEVVRRLIEAENKRVIRRYLGEVCSQGELALIEQLDASSFLRGAGPAELRKPGLARV